MSATTPPPAPTEPVFDGRSFVGGAAPAGESPSPSDGNDDGGQPADEAAPSENVEGDGASEDEPGDEGEAHAGRSGTFWDQTPEDKRPERFNNALTRSNELAKKVKEYEAKLAKYEKGEGPKPADPRTATPEAEVEAPDTRSETEVVSEIFMTALQAQDVSTLSENQRKIRGLDREVVELHKETVVPATEKLQQAEKALTDAQKALGDEQIALAWIKKRAEGREGLYSEEIAEAEASVSRLESLVTRAEVRQVNARLDLNKAEATYAQRQEANRIKALNLAKQDGRRHQETASEKEYQREYKAEEARLAKVWEDDLKAVFTEMKIPARLQKAAERIAFRSVQEQNEERGDKNPVTETEFRTLIKASLKDLAEVAASGSDLSEAEEAATRAAATDQPAPKKRTATGSGAKPMSKDEAFANVAAVMKQSRMRVA